MWIRAGCRYPRIYIYFLHYTPSRKMSRPLRNLTEKGISLKIYTLFALIRNIYYITRARTLQAKKDKILHKDIVKSLLTLICFAKCKLRMSIKPGASNVNYGLHQRRINRQYDRGRVKFYRQ